MLKFEIGSPKQTESINNNTKITHINRTNILSSKQKLNLQNQNIPCA